MSVMSKLSKQSTIKESNILSDSILFKEKDVVSTSIPALNIALSGRVDGGLTPGLIQLAGPSKHFKTLFGLVMSKAYMDKYPDAVLLFYDSEFGTPQAYFNSVGIDTNRVFHTPITDVEQLKFDVMQQLQGLQRGDKVIVMIDSIGNLASKKEVEDALESKSTTDMTRAKQLKSLFRMVTPHLTLKDIPMIAINHTYKTLEMYSKDVVGGGTGSYYSADTIFIIGRQQEKEGTDLIGYNFIINVEKSRYVREKSKIPITVAFEGGISKWSGLLDIAMETGHVVKPKVGWYARVNKATGEVEEKNYRAKDTNTKDFWLPLLMDKSFQEDIKDLYQVSAGSIVTDDEVEEAYADDVSGE